MFNITFNKIKTYLNKLIDVLIPIILVSLLLGIIFGPEAPFVGSIYTNVSNVMSMLGEDGLLALVSIIIILSYLKKN
jgi:hypothetical protein